MVPCVSARSLPARASCFRRGRLKCAAAQHGLRLLVGECHAAATATVLAADGSCGLHVGEAIFARNPLRVDALKHLLDRCERLHTVRLNRRLGASYIEEFIAAFREHYPELASAYLSRVSITKQPFEFVRPDQLQLTEVGVSAVS